MDFNEKLSDSSSIKKNDFYGINGADVKGLVRLEEFSKPHLRPNGCVVPRIEMLTYLRVRSASNARDALPLNLI